MNRRRFIKNTLFLAALAPSGLALATAYGETESTQEDSQLLRLRNRENPTAMEQKHVPAIEAPKRAKKGEWFNIVVRVGYAKEHPSTPEHWITWVKLLVDGGEVARMEYEVGGVSWPHATFRVRLQETSTIEAIEHCNLHGTWIGDPTMVTV
jgi:superoxide reductase